MVSILDLASPVIDSRIAKAPGKPFRLVQKLKRPTFFPCGGERCVKDLIPVLGVVEGNAEGVLGLVELNLTNLREPRSPSFPCPLRIVSQVAQSGVVYAQTHPDQRARKRRSFGNQ